MTGLPGVALLAASVVLSLLTSALLIRLLKVRGRVERWIGIGILFAAQVVLVAEALSILEVFEVAGFLVGQTVLALTAVAVSLRDRGGSLSEAISQLSPRSFLHRVRSTGSSPVTRVAALASSEWVLTCLVALVTAVAAFELVLALSIPPNNFDSMTYHLSRAAYWIQNHTIEQFPGASARQASLPLNAEILSAWTMMLTRGDRFTQVVQWAAMAGSVSSIYCWAIFLGWRRQAALFAALLFAILPLVVLQAASTQNDLVVAFFLTASALFLCRGLRDRHRGELALGAIGFGLAIGTKTTALFMIPGIAFLGLAAVRWRLRPLARPAAAVIAATLLLGSFSYVDNLSHGYLFGDVDTEVRTKSIGEAVRNLGDVTVALVDTGGYRGGWLEELELKRAPGTMSEDLSAYGPLGALVVLPLLIGFVVFQRRSDPKWLAIASLSYLVLFGLVYKENDFVPRLLMPFIALGAPLLAALWTRKVLVGIVVAIGVLTLIPALVSNANKPLVNPPGTPSIFNLDRLDQQTIANIDVRLALTNLEDRLASLERVAVVGDEDSWDYPYFGEHLERTVIRVDPRHVTAATFATHRVRLIIWAAKGPPAPRSGIRVSQTSRGTWALTPR